MSQAQQSEKSLNITPDDLKAIVASAVQAAVAEAKKPYLSDEDKRRLEADQQARQEQSEQVLETIKKKKNFQDKICTHMRRDNTCACVYVEGSNYILCQRCQAVIRPEKQPELFNKLFQMTTAPLIG